MPELPEVEVVRRGLDEHVVGRRILNVSVRHPRAVGRQSGGPDECVARLIGRTVVDVHRRGKFLWLALDSDEAVVCHLGMSGQMFVRSDAEEPTHLRIAFDVDDGRTLQFVDQRIFGRLRHKNVGIKRVLLDQTSVSGVGKIQRLKQRHSRTAAYARRFHASVRRSWGVLDARAA